MAAGKMAGGKMADGKMADGEGVEARRLCTSYGRRRFKVQVLRNLNMRVRPGSIYGLLGPSGCGKTTLLRCIVGRLALDAGRLVVLGAEPGAVNHGIPGSLVGYMPQETALYDQFTISETMTYFGRLHKMSAQKIQNRTDFLVDFLTLPPATGQLIGQFSGGQKRRVSFAVALLHQPKLLILDEPTVGVDPLLRTRIWSHLLEIAGNGNTTIIITTHYVEEARQADRVGLMRHGRLLAEDAPENLLWKHSCNNLEDVFLKLCHQEQPRHQQLAEEPRDVFGVQVDVADRSSSSSSSSSSLSSSPDLSSINSTTNLLTEHDEDISNHVQEHVRENRFENVSKSVESNATGYRRNAMSRFISPSNLFAIWMKNLIKMKRMIGVLVFQFVIPAVQICLFCTAIGKDPFNLGVAVVNNESLAHPNTPGLLSVRYLEYIDNDTVVQKSHRSLESARESVKNLEAWAIISMSANFTPCLINRFISGGHLDNATLEGSTIHVNMDMTNKQVALVLQGRMTSAFQEFSRELLKEAGQNPLSADIPVQIERPVYGSKDDSFTNFMAPGVILSITYFLAVGLTALAFVLERKEGLLDRTWAAGANATEIMLGYGLAQLLVMLVQISVLFIFVFIVFKVDSRGSLVLAAALTLLQGITGMMFGLCISVICTQEVSAIQLALGTFYPNLLLSGIIWPLEAMPEFLKYVSVCLPQTLAANTMRCILSRGWGLDRLQVVEGFLVTLAWLSFFFILAVVLVRFRK